MIEPAKKYEMTIEAAGLVDNAAGDKTAIEVELACEAGRLWHRMWLTPATKERVTKTLAEFGIAASDKSFWAENCQRLVGQPASVETKEEVYKDKARVVVAWLHGKKNGRESKPDSAERVADVAAMFSDALDDDSEVGF